MATIASISRVTDDIEAGARRVLLLTACAVALAAAPAAAADGCAPPDEPGWHSCLRTTHTPQDEGEVLLKAATARLVVRLERCPARPARRTMTLRDEDGDRLAARTVRGTCRGAVARWTAKVRPRVTLPDGTVVNSDWSALADGRRAPKTKLG